MVKKLFWIVTILTTACSLPALYLPYISPAQFPLSAYAFVLIPIIIIINIILLILWIYISPYKALLPLLTLLFGFPYVKRTISILHPEVQGKADFSVLSYNVRVFNVYAHLQDEHQNSSRKMLDWIIKNDASVACFQEFYNNDYSPLFCSIKKIKSSLPYCYYVPSYHDNSNGTFGMAIFSRYPIINSGFVPFEEENNNKVIYSDIKIGNDTLRVFNMHLQSLHITDSIILEARIKEVGINELEYLMKTIKLGAVKRSKQINLLNDYIKKSPYRVIVCGDLNDTPYSYSYQKLSNLLNNAFEKAGNGFGFTYISKMPLRIDNQFADDRLLIKSFKVCDSIPYSDHYPIEASYSLKD